MHITRHHDFASLASSLSAWNELAHGVPFRRWDWLEAWWRNYGCDDQGRVKPNYRLFVLTVHDDGGTLIGIAPWYQLRTRSGARVIHFLGDGEVCSDYLSILCRDGVEELVGEAIAKWLGNCNSDSGDTNDRWDRLEFIGVEGSDKPVNALLAHLRQQGSIVHVRQPMNTWRIALRTTWEEFLKKLSKQHRNRLRQADKRYFQTGHVTVHRVHTPAEWEKFFEIFVDLHQRRWQHSGLPGCFASKPFAALHREISARWSAAGLATLTWLEMDGKPLAAEYRLHGDGVMYAYQSGMDPDRLSVKPGEMGNMVAIRHAIDQGQQAYDLLRGDEEYKARWRAEPRPMLSIRVVPRRTSARLRHNAWLAGQNVKQWLKQSAKLARNFTQKRTPKEQPVPAGEPS